MMIAYPQNKQLLIVNGIFQCVCVVLERGWGGICSFDKPDSCGLAYQ